jgi:hypothetical protein
MKKALATLGLLSFAIGSQACAYAGVGGVGADKVVIARNDAFLFGALRKVFVCKVADSGVTGCQSSDSP